MNERMKEYGLYFKISNLHVDAWDLLAAERESGFVYMSFRCECVRVFI